MFGVKFSTLSNIDLMAAWDDAKERQSEARQILDAAFVADNAGLIESGERMRKSAADDLAEIETVASSRGLTNTSHEMDFGTSHHAR